MGPVTARLLEGEPANLQAQSLDILIDQAVKRGMSPNFSSLKLADGAQRDILAWPSQAVLRQWAHSFLQVWSVVPRASDALMTHIYDSSQTRLYLRYLSTSSVSVAITSVSILILLFRNDQGALQTTKFIFLFFISSETQLSATRCSLDSARIRSFGWLRLCRVTSLALVITC
jgi:hypothetical protein